MESQGHGATPLTVTRGGSFAQHRFVHQLTEPMAMAMEEHPQEPPQDPPQEIIAGDCCRHALRPSPLAIWARPLRTARMA